MLEKLSRMMLGNKENRVGGVTPWEDVGALQKFGMGLGGPGVVGDYKTSYDDAQKVAKEQAQKSKLAELAAGDPAAARQYLGGQSETGLAGYLDYQDKQNKPKERKILKDIAGRQRYVDDGSLVYPNAKPKELTQTQKLDIDLKEAQLKKIDAESKQLDVFSPAASSGGVEVTGEEFLSQLSPAISRQVKALAEGKMSFPSSRALSKPYWQEMMKAVSQYDPNFDAVNYKARASTRRDFTSGVSARNISALNTAIGHLGSLKKSAKKLKNTDYPAYNWIANITARHTGDTEVQAALKETQASATAVAGELAKVFRSSGMSVAEIDEWKEELGTSNTPAETDSIINKAVDLMNSRLFALGDQYNRGMGTTADPFTLLSSHAREVLEELGVGGHSTMTDEEQKELDELEKKYSNE